MPTATGTRTYRLVVDNQQAIRELKKMGIGMEKVDKSVKSVQRSVDRTSKQLKSFGSNLRNAILGGGIAFAIVRLAQGFRDVSDSALELNQRLTSITRGDAAAAEVTLGNVLEVSQRLGVSIVDLTASLQKFRVAVPSQDVDTLLFSLETLSQALVTTGASTQSTNAVLLQMSQGLGTGALRGDEFRSVLENAPVVLQAWAEALGRGGESLVQLRDENAFTTQSFIELREEIREAITQIVGVDQPADTFSRAMTRIGNSFVATFVEFRAATAEGGPLVKLNQLLNSLATDVIPGLLPLMIGLADVVSTIGNNILDAIPALDGGANAIKGIGEEVDGTSAEIEVAQSAWTTFFQVDLPASIESSIKAIGALAAITEETMLLVPRLAQALSRGGLDEAGAEFDRIANRIRSIRSEFDNDVLSAFETRQRAVTTRADRRTELGDRPAGLLGTGTGFPTRPTKGGGSKRSAADRAAEQALKKLERQTASAAQTLREFNAEQAEQTRGFEQSIELIGLTEREQTRLNAVWEQEGEIRKLQLEQADLLAEKNLVEAEGIGAIITQLEQLAALRETQALQLFDAEAQQDALEKTREEAKKTAEDISSFFSDSINDVVQAAVTGARSVSDVLKSIAADLGSTLLKSGIQQLIGPLVGGALGGGGGGGGFGGLFGSLFGGLFGGGSSSSGASTAGYYQSVTPAYTSGPEMFMGGVPNVSVVNNGAPLSVQSSNMRGGELTVVVDTAVAASEQRYQRSMRSGFGAYSESVNASTTARRNV